jgi:hypothetical protein
MLGTLGTHVLIETMTYVLCRRVSIAFTAPAIGSMIDR